MNVILDSNNVAFAQARSGKRLPHLLVALLTAIIFVYAGTYAGRFIVSFLVQYGPPWLLPPNTLSTPAARSAVSQIVVLLFVYVPLALLLWAWLTWFERRPFSSLGFQRRGALAKYLLGLLDGMAAFSLTVGMAAALGVVGVATLPAQREGLAALGAVVLIYLGWGVQSASEECVFRGWLLPVLGARYRPWVGILVSSVLFGAIHLSNRGFGPLALLNISLFGVFAALYRLREGSLWGACAFHGAWNWTQGNILGLNVSGFNVFGGVLLPLKATGPAVFTGGIFGLENSLPATGALLAGIVLLLVFSRGAIRVRRPTPTAVTA